MPFRKLRGSASYVFSSRWIQDNRLQHFSLLVGKVHAPLLLLKGHITEPLYSHFHIYEIACGSTDSNVAAGIRPAGVHNSRLVLDRPRVEYPLSLLPNNVPDLRYVLVSAFK